MVNLLIYIQHKFNNLFDNIVKYIIFRFIKKELNKLVNQFPNIKCIYGLDNDGTHLVEITPNSVYVSNKYLDAEEVIDGKFGSKFKEFALLFISDNEPYLKIENLKFIISGTDYNK